MQTNFRTTKPFLHYGILALIYGVGIVTLASHTIIHASTHPHEESHSAAISTSLCSEPPKHTYQLVFTDTGVAPSSITADYCDAVTVLNSTTQEMSAALGSHPHHVHYPGFEEKAIQPGESYSFRAAEASTFLIHDHDDARLSATLIVRQ